MQLQGVADIRLRLTYQIVPIHLALHCYAQEFKLQNIVGSCDVKFPIRLEGLSYAHGIFSSVSLHETVMIASCYQAAIVALSQQRLHV